MTRPPDRLLQTTDSSRIGTTIKSLAPGGNLGQTSRARRVVQLGALGALRATGIFAIVYHGDDPDVIRPAVMLTYWIGAAHPNNGNPIDFIYPETL